MKFHRFSKSRVPQHVAKTVYTNLQRLSKLVPPRVCSAAGRVIFNGWCTKRRFQDRTSSHNICYLGCGGNAEDSIEHYCRCDVVAQVFKQKFHIGLAPKRGLSFFCMATPEQRQDDILALSMLGVYAVYMSTNHYRSIGHCNPSEGKNSMGQHIIQGCQGHKRLTKLVQDRWNAPFVNIKE